MKKDYNDNIITDFSASLEILTGTTPKERKDDFMLKTYYFIKHKCRYDYNYNLNSFFGKNPEDVTRKRFQACLKEMIQRNWFLSDEVEMNEENGKFRKRLSPLLDTTVKMKKT